MCGCTWLGMPACTARAFRRERIWLGVSRVPWRPTKSAGCSALASAARSGSQACSAARAALPTGTLRRLLPLPSTCASPPGRSIQPRASALACTSSPTSSAMRRPLP